MFEVQMVGINKEIGTYAVSTMNNYWVQEKAPPPVVKERRTRGNKIVIHQIFDECTKLVDDPFWVEKFRDASRGKFPKYFYYQDNTLIYKKSAKEKSLEVPDDPSEAVIDCIDFFKQQGSMFSELDQINVEVQQQAAVPFLWTDLNAKTKALLVDTYIIKMSKLMQLTPNEMNNLTRVVRTGVHAKFFAENNIFISNKAIIEIRGLFWDEYLKIFYIDPKIKPKKNSSRKTTNKIIEPDLKDTIPNFYQGWEKFIKFVEKKEAKYEKICKNRCQVNIIIDTDSPEYFT